MEITEKFATLLMIVPAGIWAGSVVFYAVERVNLWAQMPIDQYVVDFRRSVHRADPLQPILAILAVFGSTAFAITAGGTAANLAWAGTALIVAVIVFSIALLERINSQFRRRKEGEAPPDAAQLRSRWHTLHLIRTVPTVLALIFLVLATTFA